MTAPDDATLVMVLDAGDLAAMRQVAAAVARAAGLDGERTRDFSLAANELCTTSLAMAGGPAVIRVWSTDREVCCETREPAPHVPEADDVLGAWLEPDRGERHEDLGLLLVNELCDRVEVNLGANGQTTRLSIRVGLAAACR